MAAPKVGVVVEGAALKVDVEVEVAAEADANK